MSVKVRDIHAQSPATSSALSEYYVPNLITPLQVIRVLNAAKVRFMLLGAHGLSGWMGKPRATEDVDVLVGMRGHKKAVRAGEKLGPLTTLRILCFLAFLILPIFPLIGDRAILYF
jgi:hypothetical protein